MSRVPFGTTASPFLRTATLSYHFEKTKDEFPEKSSRLSACLCVDDFITGAATTEAARIIYFEAMDIMHRAGMVLDKWSSSSRELEGVIGSSTSETLALGSQEKMKVLGVVWHKNEDKFKFDPSAIMEFLMLQRDTERFVLQASARFFDPLGFLAPFVIRVKVLFQLGTLD